MISLQTQNLPTVSNAPRAVATPTVEAPVQDAVDVRSHEIDEKNFSWLDLGKGVAGAVVGGTIEGVGGLAAGIIKSPRVTIEAVRGTWKSKMLGKTLKATLTPVIVVAGCLVPIFTALGGLGYGLFEGFSEGAKNNPIAAGGKAIDTCKQMHGKFTKEIVEGIREAATKEPSSPDEVYNIKVVEGGQGLVSSVASAVIDGVGAAGTTLYHIPGGYVKASKEIWKSDAALPLKVGGQFLATAAAIVAVPLVGMGGVLYGLGKGAYNGYQKGIVESTKLAGHDIAELHRAMDRLIKD